MSIKKILHFSDTHLGFSEYNRISPITGLNQREQDFYDAWLRTIDNILLAQPDLIIHAGDLFHTPRPSNRAIRVALEGIQKISDAGIPMVLISGNHETPRIRTTGSIFESIALFDHVDACHQSLYECIHIDNIDLHCIPHCSLSEELTLACESIILSKKAEANVLISHGVWTDSQAFSMGEFNEQRLPDLEKSLKMRFDYVALGHYHRSVKIRPNIWYSGATERTSLSQADASCGFLILDLSTGKVEYQSLPARPMVRLQAILCQQLSVQEIYQQVESNIIDVPQGAIVSLTLTNVDQHVFLKMDPRTFDEMLPGVLHLEKQINVQTNYNRVGDHGDHIEPLTVEFGKYLLPLDLEESERDILYQLGMNYLTEY